MTAIAIPRPIGIPNGIKWGLLGFLGVVVLLVTSPTLDLVNVSTAPDEAKDLLSLADETVAESAGVMTFQVVRSADAGGIIAYDYRTVRGTTQISDNQDYEHLQGTAWISSGETKDHDVPILNDAIGEDTEAFTFEVFNIRFLE